VTDQTANGLMGSKTLALDGGQFLAARHDLSPGKGLAVYMGQHAGWAIKQVQTQWRRKGNFLLQQESNTESLVV
jgi:hypothetical protein